MPYRPNYRLQRSDRNRAKELKKQEKLARRAEASEKRKAAREAGAADPAPPEGAQPGGESDGD
jgi:hypothetical protein